MREHKMKDDEMLPRCLSDALQVPLECGKAAFLWEWLLGGRGETGCEALVSVRTRRAPNGAIPVVFCFQVGGRVALAMKKGGNGLEAHVSAGQGASSGSRTYSQQGRALPLEVQGVLSRSSHAVHSTPV